MISKYDRVLVTGATGFLGQSLYRELSKQGYYNILALKHNDFEKNFLTPMCELLDFQQTKTYFQWCKPKHVIHLAGLVGGIGANRSKGGEFTYKNLQIGLNVIEAARLYNVEKVVMIGTVCCYPSNTPVPFREDQIYNGMPEITNSGYGIAKRALMKMCSEYNKQHGMKNISVVPVNLMGPGEHYHLENSHVIPSLIMKFNKAIKERKDVVLWGTGKCSREFLYVDDCSRGIIKAMECNACEGPINLGTGKEITIYDLAHKIAKLMNFNGKIVWDTTKPDGQLRRCLDVSLAKQMLRWEATTSLEEGLVNTIQDYRERFNV